MKEITFKLIVKCESEATAEGLLQTYLEKYLINQRNLEAIQLRMIAGDEMKPAGFGLVSMKLEKEKKKEPINAPRKTTKKTTKRKPVSKTSKS